MSDINIDVELIKNFGHSFDPSPYRTIEKFVKEITEQKNNEMAMEFTKHISQLLKDNSVAIKTTEVDHIDTRGPKIEQKYGVIIELDFSEHDKLFEDKIAELENIINHKLGGWNKHGISYQEILDMETENKELKHCIAGLESKETIDLPFDPMKCADYLINATYERKTSELERAFCGRPEKVRSNRYTVDDLEQIAEHLFVYCKHNKEHIDNE